jgi:hypothetical protein
VTTVPACAARCPLVALLLNDASRARGVSIAVVRVTHGLPAVTPDLTPEEVNQMTELLTPQRPQPRERCGSCNGVINPHTGECRCSD